MAEARINVERVATDQPPTGAADFIDSPINVKLYERMMEYDIIGHKAPFFLWHGKLVEKEELPGGDGLRPYRIGLDRYRKMVASGVFKPGEPVTLWQGRLVKPMMPDHTQNFISSLLLERLIEIVESGWVVMPRRLVAISEWSLPEPDFTIVRGRPRDYLERWPDSLDVGLLIEVADSSLAIDRGIKLRAYAQSRLPWYGIINIPDRRVEVYEKPMNLADGPGHAVRCDYLPGQSMPVVLDGDRVGWIAVDEIFPA